MARIRIPKNATFPGYYAPIPGSSTGIGVRFGKQGKHIPRAGRRGRGGRGRDLETLSKRESATRLLASGKVSPEDPEIKRMITGRGTGEEDIPFSETPMGVARTMRTRGLVKVGGDWVTRGARRKFAGERTQRQLATRVRERARGLDVRSMGLGGVTLRGPETQLSGGATLTPESEAKVRGALTRERLGRAQEDIDIRKEIMEGDTAKRERVSAAHAASGYEVPKGYPPAKEPIMGYNAYQKALAPQGPAAAPTPSPHPAAPTTTRPIPSPEEQVRLAADAAAGMLSYDYVAARLRGEAPPPSPPRPVMPPDLAAQFGQAGLYPMVGPPPVLPPLPGAAPTVAAPQLAAAPAVLPPEQQDAIRQGVEEHMRTRFRTAVPGAPPVAQPGEMNLAEATRVLPQPPTQPPAPAPIAAAPTGGGFMAGTDPETTARIAGTEERTRLMRAEREQVYGVPGQTGGGITGPPAEVKARIAGMGSTVLWPEPASFTDLAMKGGKRAINDWMQSVDSTRNNISRQLANMSPQQMAQFAGVLATTPGYAEMINKMKDLEDYGYIEDLGLPRVVANSLARDYRAIYDMIQQAIAGRFSNPNYPQGGFPQSPAQSPVSVPAQRLYTPNGPPVPRSRSRGSTLR